MSATHIYHRLLNPESQDSLAKIAHLVHPSSRVLDLGSGPGVLGHYLAEALYCVVDGIEYNPDAVNEAARWYRRLECADLENIVLAEYFVDQQYDFIICADVLEHLRHPGKLLAQLTGLLAPNGRVLVSVPNVAYAGLIADLLAGEFRYRSEGLLDETHLRFFTLNSFNRLLEEHGLWAVNVDVITRNLQESEFSAQCLDSLPPVLMNALLSRPESLAYQFIITAVAVSEIANLVPLVLVSPPPELQFMSQLFWKFPGGTYQEGESSIAWGRVGQSHQQIVLPFPARSISPQVLRLDFADRPGLMRLYKLALYNSAHELLWEWDGRRESLAKQPSRQLAFAHPALSVHEITLLLAGEDPNLELPIPAEALEALQGGGEVRVDFSWPMSLDYLALVQDCIPRSDVIAKQSTMETWINHLESGHVVLTEQITEWQEKYASLMVRKKELEAEVMALTASDTAMAQQLELLKAHLAEQRSARWGLRTRLMASIARCWQIALRRWRHRT